MYRFDLQSARCFALPALRSPPKMITAHQLTKIFAGPDTTAIPALGPLDLNIAAGEFVCIVGPSGCGKSTLLRLIAGLEPATSGTLSIQANEMPAGLHLQPTLVFQGDLTFPWLTVFENIEYGLKMRGVESAPREAAVNHMLQLVGLTAFVEAYPYQLSGGMKQRVALARAWAADPAILLMDEPFGALDEQTRFLLQAELLRIWEQDLGEAAQNINVRKTILFVTHSIDEALTLADRVLVMSAAPGKIKDEIAVPFARPRNVEHLKRDAQFGELHYRVWQALKDEVKIR